jgi:hypothetical protein
LAADIVGEKKAGMLEKIKLRIFGTRRDEVTAEWKGLNNE